MKAPLEILEITKTTCPTCMGPIYLTAPLAEGLQLGCAACCAWLGNGIPPWVDSARHYWWLDSRDEPGAKLATLFYTLRDGTKDPQHATHRLRCAGIPPMALRDVRGQLFPGHYLVVVEPGDWRMPFTGGSETVQ
jgi:hypothetical protein